jgi:hypothetical protein
VKVLLSFKRAPPAFSCRYNASRPHRGLQLAVPEPSTGEAGGDGRVSRRDRLGGLIHEYYREAA